MAWKEVGTWLKENAGTGAALVGSLLTGNVPAAVAAGISLVSSATGHATPDEALKQFQNDPATVVRLRELALQNDASIREHIRLVAEADLKDKQAEHHETQETIRSADNAEDIVVRRTRPLQSWASLVGALVYVGYGTVMGKPVDGYILGALLTLPWTYAGLRQIGKSVEAVAQWKVKGGGAK
jgi:hypothetical protein